MDQNTNPNINLDDDYKREKSTSDKQDKGSGKKKTKKNFAPFSNMKELISAGTNPADPPNTRRD